MDDRIIGNIIELDHLDGNISQIDHLGGNLNSSGDEQTVYRGYSAYEIALQQGFEGSKDEWLRSLVGPQGETGISVSDVRLNEDFTLTVTLDDGTEFTTDPIKGDKGQKGEQGQPGPQGQQGIQGPQGQKGQKGDTGEKGEKGQTGPQGETGPAFTYEDFTPEQLEGLRGPQGQTGSKGDKGQKGDTGQRGPQGQTGQKGDTGNSGVYIGTEEPEDQEVRLWIDTTSQDSMQTLSNLIISRLSAAEEVSF